MTRPTPLTIQQIIDRSSHCMVTDGAGQIHDAVKAKLSDLRTLERELAESKAQLTAWRAHGKLLGFTCGAFEIAPQTYHIFQNELTEPSPPTPDRP